MKAETILYSLQEVDEDLLDRSMRGMTKRQGRPWGRVALAAALTLAVGLGGLALWRTLGKGSAEEQTASLAPATDGTGETDPKQKEDARPLSELAVEELGPGTLIDVGAFLLCESDRQIIFYGQFGVVCYDLEQCGVRYTVDLNKAVVVPGGSAPEYGLPIQGSEGCHIETSADGSALLLYYLDAESGRRGTACRIDAVRETYVFTDEAEPLLPDGETRSFAGALECYGNTLGSLCYIRDDQVWQLFPTDESARWAIPMLTLAGNFDTPAPLYSLTDVELKTELCLWTPERAAEDGAFRTLPVFEDQRVGAEDGVLGVEEMMRLTEEVLSALGEPDFHVEINFPSSGPYDPETLTQHTDRFTVEVTNRGRVTVTFTEPLPYPDDPAFDADDPRQVRENYVAYLSELLNVPWAESWELEAQSTEAAKNPRYAAGRTSSDYEEHFLADALQELELDLGPTNQLLCFSFYSAECLRAWYLPLGDYEILSYDEAVAAFRAGAYLQTQAPGDYLPYTGEDDAPIRVELVYATEGEHLLRMPYYRFWVLTEQANPEPDTGGFAYLAYDVPAIRQYCFADPLLPTNG